MLQASKTYPGIQELYATIKKLTVLQNFGRIFHPTGLNSESISSLRHQLFIHSFDSVASVIETLMPPKDEYLLSLDARIALRSAFTNAHHFAAVILPHFYQHDTLDLLCNNKEHIQLA